jgi:hypothetical protein
VHDLVLRAIESNLNHVHTDCPTFEKLGWWRASQQMAPSIMYSKDVDSLWSKIARDALDSQYGRMSAMSTAGFANTPMAGPYHLDRAALRQIRPGLGPGQYWTSCPGAP